MIQLLDDCPDGVSFQGLDHPWGGIPKSKLQGLFRIQKRCVRLLFGSEYSFDHSGYYETCARVRTYQNHKSKKNYCIEHTKPLFSKHKILSFFNLHIYHTFINTFITLPQQSRNTFLSLLSWSHNTFIKPSQHFHNTHQFHNTFIKLLIVVSSKISYCFHNTFIILSLHFHITFITLP